MRTTVKHEPTEKNRKQVSSMSMAGIDQEIISSIIEVDAKTLRKYYRKELDHATAKVVTSVAGKLFEQCMGGNIQAMIFLLKTRGRWKETQEIEHTSPDGSMQPTVDATKLSAKAIKELLKAQVIEEPS